MRRVLPGSLLAVALIALGVGAGIVADTSRVSALVLQAEPFLLVAALWTIAALRWARRPALALALAMGTVGFVAALRLPYGTEPPGGVPPPWVGPVSRCAAAARAPAAPVRLLQWTVDTTVTPTALVAAARTAAADVVVLHGALAPGATEALVEVTGGEARTYEDGQIAIVASGGFHPCGEEDAWTEGLETPDGYALAFVGVPPATVFPLVATRFPGVLEPRWRHRTERARARTYDLLGALEGAGVVVVADAAAPRTYRHLEAGMAALGLFGVPVPPSWPAHVGSVPVLPLHPYARVWAGPIWAVREARAVAASIGARAPVLAVLGPRAESVTP